MAQMLKRPCTARQALQCSSKTFMQPCVHKLDSGVSAGVGSAMLEDGSVQQLDKGRKKQPGKRSSKRMQKSGAEEPSQPGSSGRRQGKLPGGIFSEHTLGSLADAVASTVSQLPAMAAGDLPDDLPAEPVVFWPPASQDAHSDPGQVRFTRADWTAQDTLHAIPSWILCQCCYALHADAQTCTCGPQFLFQGQLKMRPLVGVVL